MEFLIGIQGSDFVLLAADTSSARSIVVFKQDEDKMVKLGERTAMAVVGESGDVSNFSEFIQKRIKLYALENGYELSPSGIASYTRTNLSRSLRTRNHNYVNVLLGGVDPKEGPCLYFMDYLASSIKVPFAAHGYGSYFVLSLLDRWYKPDLTQEEAVDIIGKCMEELRKRFFVQIPSVRVRIIDETGVNDIKEEQKLRNISQTPAYTLS